jgi:hypothetical protein
MIPGITAGQMTQGAPAVSLFLDTYPGAVVAFSSSRKLRVTYSGPCMRVRRVSDGAEQDIGFIGSLLDVAAISSFCAGTTGRVATWYDQSGNGVNVTQATQSAMPIIYQSGAVTLINSTPALSLTGAEGLVTSTAVPWPMSVGELTAVCAYRLSGGSTSILVEGGYPGTHASVTGGLLIDVLDGGSSVLIGGSGGSGTTSYGKAPSISIPHNRVFKGVWNPAGTTLATEIPTFQVNNTTPTISSVGSPSSSSAVSQFSNTGIAIGCRGNASSLRLVGALGELVLYPGTSHAASSAIDLDVMTQYGI